MTRTLWYAEGLRWIGSLFNGAAERLERAPGDAVQADPRVQREAETYMDNVRTRVHIHF
jgi:hypothetical protein